MNQTTFVIAWPSLRTIDNIIIAGNVTKKQFLSLRAVKKKFSLLAALYARHPGLDALTSKFFHINFQMFSRKPLIDTITIFLDAAHKARQVGDVLFLRQLEDVLFLCQLEQVLSLKVARKRSLSLRDTKKQLSLRAVKEKFSLLAALYARHPGLDALTSKFFHINFQMFNRKPLIDTITIFLDAAHKARQVGRVFSLQQVGASSRGCFIFASVRAGFIFAARRGCFNFSVLRAFLL